MKTDFEKTKNPFDDKAVATDVVTRGSVIACGEKVQSLLPGKIRGGVAGAASNPLYRDLALGQRERSEEEDEYFSCFEVDKDRILLSPAFRRLARKTQVFAFPNDHQRNRLTHAVEVSQIASKIAKALGLNVYLAEAIALGHDIGHGPGGHAAEQAFSQFIPGYFYHGSFGADVVLAPMNLCLQTLDGIRNHSWSRPLPGTEEALVVSFADRIAYCTHDLEDALQIGLVGKECFPKEILSFIGEDKASQVKTFIKEIIFCFENYSLVGMRREYWEALTEFRKFNFEFIYNSPEVEMTNQMFISLDKALVEFFTEHTEMLPAVTARGTPKYYGAEEDPLRRSINFVATMTDDYALYMGRELLDFKGLQRCFPIQICN